jgi:linoleoyl-CoA desaturase
MKTPKFTHSSSFSEEMKTRIQEYFQSTGKAKTGNFQLWGKALILISSWILVYVHLVFFTPSSNWQGILECVLLGGLTASIGFNVMHDGAHGSFSKYPVMNKAAAVTLCFLGGSHFMWNVKHNIIHHAYTNIDGIDDDIDARPFLRMAPTQKHHPLYKYQHIYFWFFYCWLHLFWIFFSDFKKYFSRKVGDVAIKKMSFMDHFWFWAYKVVSYSLFLVIPMFTVGVWPAIIGFLTMTFVAGFVISIIFQLAHTVEDTHFPMPNVVTAKMEDEWTIHQIKTTANFATRNRVVSWLVGGLNFQIEHHLFPKISHIHYPAISRIIRQVCSEYGVVYVEYPRLHQAVASHVMFLKRMGRAVA